MEMPPVQERPMSPGRRDRYLTIIQCILQRTCRGYLQSSTSRVANETLDGVRRVVEYRNRMNGPHQAKGPELRAALNARSYDGGPVGSGHREHIGANGARQTCAEGREVAAFHHRQRFPGGESMEHQNAPNCRITRGKLCMDCNGVCRNSRGQPRG